MPWTNPDLPAEPDFISSPYHPESRPDATRPNRPLSPTVPAHSPRLSRVAAAVLACVLGLAAGAGVPGARSLDLGVNDTGLSIGNSKNWTGIRINTIDIGVERITGANLTLWKPHNNRDATVTGLSLGLVTPDAGVLRGVQMGVVGVGASREITGISAGILGVGSHGSLNGISIGGFGAGAGMNMTGISIGGLGAGAGQNVTGILIAGLAAGAGGDMKGLTFALLGAGAGQNMTGITLAGLAAGAGASMRGVTFALLGAGSGGDMTGLTVAGLAAGAGNQMKGLAVSGFGAGAPVLRGVALGGLFTGGADIKGATLTAGWTRVSEDGSYSGLAIGSFNQIRGSQTGLSIGIVNYTRQLRGVQIGIVNHVAENPAILRTLPFINAHF